MTNEKIPPEWVKMASKTRPDMYYFFNKSNMEAYWSNDIHFDKDGKYILSPNAKQLGNLSRRPVKVTDDDLDDQVIAKLYEAKSHISVQHSHAQSLNENLKRKHEENVTQYHKEDSEQNCCTVESKSCTQPTRSIQGSEVSCKIKKTSDQKHQVNISTERGSKSSSSTNYPRKHFKNGRTKTPIQDRFDRLREELLNKQETIISEDSGISEPSSKENNTPRRDTNGNCKIKERPNTWPQKHLHSTPIQDKYNKTKCLLLKKQEETNTKSQDNVFNQRLKRKTSDQEVDASQDEKQCKILKRNNFQAHPQRHSPDSAKQTRKIITFDIPQSDYPVAESENSSLKKVPFDLRTMLQQRKARATSHNLQSDVISQMDWETSYPATPVSQEVVNNPLLPTQERHPCYSNIYLVCDTSALVRDHVFVENLIVKGSYLGLPVKIVIPFVALDELDHMKRADDEVGYQARQVSRIIQSSHSGKHMDIQEGDKKREAVGSYELKVNDDLVLNCCLQVKEKTTEKELVVLITNDINLANKASSFKVQTYNWYSFKRWARGLREYKPLPCLPDTSKRVSPLTMSVDEETCEEGVEDSDLSTPKFIAENKTMCLEGTVINCNQKLLGEPFSSSTRSRKQENTNQSHLEELKSDFQTFLHNVLEEAYEKNYEPTIKISTNIKPSWNVVDYIYEVKKRWFLLTDSHLSPSVERIFYQLISIFKKYNSGKEELKFEDVDDQFNRCALLADIIAKHLPKHAHLFLETLNALRDDWREAYCNLSEASNVETMIEDIDPVDVALQNIYHSSYSDYDNLKVLFDSNKFDTTNRRQLKVFYGKIADVELIMKKLFQEKPDVLTIKNQYIIQLHKTVTFFVGVRGNLIGFDIAVENVVELFQNKAFRNNANQLIEKFEHLKNLIDDLICKAE